MAAKVFGVVARMLPCSCKSVLNGCQGVSMWLPGCCDAAIKSDYHGIAMKILDVLCGFQGFAV